MFEMPLDGVSWSLFRVSSTMPASAPRSMQSKLGRITSASASRASLVPTSFLSRSVRVWQQRLKSIKLRDGSFHDGQLELVTWPSRSGRKGWGGVVVEESEEMRNKYLTEFRSDDQKVRPVFR